MKIYSFLILVLVILTTACVKPNCGCAPPPPQVSMYDSKWSNGGNNIGWNGELTDTINNDLITIFGKRVYDGLKLNFSVPGEMTLDPQHDARIKKFEAFYYINNYHAAPTQYNLDTTANNELGAYKYTTNTVEGGNQRWLSGFYKLTFKLAKPTGNIITDTTRIRFTSGSFTTRWYN
ncbi:MAG: hypothetical protein V4553_13860 [Bacteroidota bacterium]